MMEDKIVRLVLKDAAMLTWRVVGVASLALHLDRASQYWVMEVWKTDDRRQTVAGIQDVQNVLKLEGLIIFRQGADSCRIT